MTTDAAPDPVAEVTGSDVTVAPVRTRRPGRSLAWLGYLLLIPACLVFLAPLGWLISASFQPLGDIFSWPPQWIPRHPTLDGYKGFLGLGGSRVEGAPEAWRWFLNSAFIAISVT